MKALRFTIAIAELVASPAILVIYGLIGFFATMRLGTKPVLDFCASVR